MARNVRNLLKEFNLSQRETARQMNVTIGTVNKWFHNDTQPSWELARTFMVSYDWLVGDTPIMWSYKMLQIQERTRQMLMETPTPMTVGNRFRMVGQHLLKSGVKDWVMRFYLAYPSKETFELDFYGSRRPDDYAIKRLASMSNIPAEWFEDGSHRHLQGGAAS